MSFNKFEQKSIKLRISKEIIGSSKSESGLIILNATKYFPLNVA
jgi:hypothetical protein